MSENKEITKELLLDIRATLKEAFKPLVEKHGVNVSLGNISYSPEEATGKLIIQMVNSMTPGEITEKNKAEFEKFATAYGLKASWFGKEFTSGDKGFKISKLIEKVELATSWLLPQRQVKTLAKSILSKPNPLLIN